MQRTGVNIAKADLAMKQRGLYNPQFEHDGCGVGFVVNVNGQKTHQIVSEGITILKNLEHRGAVGGDSKTGDGAGMMVQIPHEFFIGECDKFGFHLPDAGEYGVGMFFLPHRKKLRGKAINIIEATVTAEGGAIAGWRDVPVRPDCLGTLAESSMPFIAQLFITFPDLSGDALERRLFITRKCIESTMRKASCSLEMCYIVSFSSKTITYKGMFVAPQFEYFFPDLADNAFQSALAVVHQRYSTNTFPSWPLAQPFRCLAHNGEINTLRGNINKMIGREKTVSSPLFGDDIGKLLPIVDTALSDSGIFDNVFELLAWSGRSMEHSIMMMVPEAFGAKYHISEDKRAFYEYHAAIMEPWDGPAVVVFTDGVKVGATLDRNGLRPARYIVTKSDKVVMASEVGVLDISPEDVLEKGRLAPGKMFLIDTAVGRIIYDNEIKASISRRKPYRRWLENSRIELKELFGIPGSVDIDHESLRQRQAAFGYTLEEVESVLIPMAENGQEPVSSMGNDAALAVLSPRPQLLYNYFKQLFAQVTNPPIDPYRENLVMSLMSFVGREGNLLDETPKHCHQLKLPHPVLTNDDMAKLYKVDVDGYRSTVLPMLLGTAAGEAGLTDALDDLCRKAEQKVDEGYSLLIISDRNASAEFVPIPALLATAALHHHLVRVQKRHLTGLIIESGEVRDVMHFATLIGYGASAVNPYLVFEILADLKQRGKLTPRLEVVFEHYITAIKKGLLKVMSKMGVSTIRSYRSAQIFEAIGLDQSLIDRYFPGTASRIGGIGIDGIAREALERHRKAFSRSKEELEFLAPGGNIHFRAFSEKHLYSAEAITAIHQAVREESFKHYRRYADLINDAGKNLCTLRGLFRFKEAVPVPLEEVEPVESIVKRFVSSAMSFGSISKEAHETIAIAMNRLGAASNSGEGGEDEERYQPLPNGDLKKSMIKQVASGRFGVTINYLVNSRELQIKMAQGAKPGEGGQLAGLKVDETIAKVRHSTPGVTLISPPPHHDIYSIEDLAQLIFDLKNANHQARISVKLVAESGVGTVAAGVAKGKAEMVLISGHDGGTGNAPISSIKHAGIPWEIGLAETQQTLILNHLRDRITVQADGQMRTGRDIVIAALLGAEEYGFGTASLVSLGCIMMRKCHINTCPVGVATQDPILRKRFAGRPEHLINFMRFVAQDTREIMARIGFRTVNDMVGRVDMIDSSAAVSHWKTRGLDFTKVLAPVDVPEGGSRFRTRAPVHDFSLSLDAELIAKSKKAIDSKERVSLFASIRNCNRTVGATLSSEATKRYGAAGLPPDTIACKFTGSAGQSFGAFLAPGITFELEGDANDYFGKGLSGGKLIVYPPKSSTFRPHNNIITGNVNLFGATGGDVFINGMAGERFAVRNSGATAVVEGVGDHGCEYMTGGTVVVIGRTGVNFAAGMSGGIAYILDEDQLFDTKCNLEMVDIEPVSLDHDRAFLRRLIERHVEYTGSEHASRILRDWTEMAPRFVKVIPIDYRDVLERLRKAESKETDVVSLTEEVY
ncbi:MAG: glutamate synthase large subunit [Chitinispirillaceae bacterium]|nr:glutamate synthase large subunit [Chitinispirillaceae bacterium]